MWSRLRDKGKKVNPFKKGADQPEGQPSPTRRQQHVSTPDATSSGDAEAARSLDRLPDRTAQIVTAPSAQPEVAATHSPLGVVTLSKSGCLVCRDLDPLRGSKATDGLTEDSWATKEYDINPTTSAGVIEVKDAKEILISGPSGCIYCMILGTALNAVRPGWDTEDVFLNIYVADGLPVVVRLSFGKIVQVPRTTEQLQRSGIVLPQGRTMTLTLTVTDPSKPAVEIELYRREEKAAEKRMTLAPLTDRFGFARERNRNAGDEVCFTFIENNMNICAASGHACTSPETTPALPDRVIWLNAPTTDGMQLVEPKGRRAQYVTLSYCWGPDKNPYLTSSATLKSRLAQIRTRDLPILFQDVVKICRRLGIDYLWIDRLCIIQGSDGDFEVQAPKMGQIYGNSTLTIVAASAETENDSILTARDSLWWSYSLDIALGDITSLEVNFRRRSCQVGTEHQGGDYGKVSSRAWIWQERLLSTRSIFYTPSALKFECRCMSAWEGDHQSYVGHSWSSQLYARMDDNRRLLRWAALVEEFTKRQITFASDRLPAIEAVMNVFGKQCAWTAVEGMWREKLLETLSWEAEETFKWNQEALKSQNAGSPSKQDTATYRWPSSMPTDYAPTWAWPSVDGQITYRQLRAKSGANHDADPYSYVMEIIGLEQDRLTVKTYFVCDTIRMHKEESSSGVSKTIYEVGSEEHDQWFELQADAPLAPFSVPVPGRGGIGSTRRVAYGTSPPSEPWTSRCFCLMLGKSSLRCETLVVGISPRSIQHVERLGILFGMEPGQYVDPRPTQFVIV